jgi:hypothetical protein
VLLNALRPKPFRGDVIAAGVVVLATLVWLVRIRFAAAWGDSAQLVWATLPWAFVMVLALLAELEGDAPRAYQSILYIASVVLWIAVVASFGAAFGTGAAFGSARVTTIEALLVSLLALGFAIGRNSAVCTLLGSLFGGLAFLALFEWAFSPGIEAFRWAMVVLTAIYAIGAVGQRDRHLRHGVALIDAAGTAVLSIGLTFAVAEVAQRLTGAVADDSFGARDEYQVHVFGNSLSASVGWGWELLILAAGFGLIAYSSVDRQPGPAYLGVLNLIVFAVMTSLGTSAANATLIGWPLVLVIAAVLLLAIGLRPTTPAPPPPDVDAPEPPPLPLR